MVDITSDDNRTLDNYQLTFASITESSCMTIRPIIGENYRSVFYVKFLVNFRQKRHSETYFLEKKKFNVRRKYSRRES